MSVDEAAALYAQKSGGAFWESTLARRQIYGSPLIWSSANDLLYMNLYSESICTIRTVE